MMISDAKKASEPRSSTAYLAGCRKGRKHCTCTRCCAWELLQERNWFITLGKAHRHRESLPSVLESGFLILCVFIKSSAAVNVKARKTNANTISGSVSFRFIPLPIAWPPSFLMLLPGLLTRLHRRWNLGSERNAGHTIKNTEIQTHAEIHRKRNMERIEHLHRLRQSSTCWPFTASCILLPRLAEGLGFHESHLQREENEWKRMKMRQKDRQRLKDLKTQSPKTKTLHSWALLHWIDMTRSPQGSEHEYCRSPPGTAHIATSHKYATTF